MCKCIDLVNKKLAENNTQLVIPITINMETGDLNVSHRVMITTEKIDIKKRIGPTKMFAAYCPVCGKAYPKKAKK